jgi:hypothetical protein
MEALTVLLILFLGGICAYMFFTGPASFLTFVLLFSLLAFILVHFKFITIDISKNKNIDVEFTGEPIPTSINIPHTEETHPVSNFFERMENFITGNGWYLDSEIEAAQKAINSTNTMKSSTQEALRAAKAAKDEAEKAEKAAKLASDEAGKISPDSAKIASLSPATASLSPECSAYLKSTKIIRESQHLSEECRRTIPDENSKCMNDSIKEGFPSPNPDSCYIDEDIRSSCATSIIKAIALDGSSSLSVQCKGELQNSKSEYFNDVSSKCRAELKVLPAIDQFNKSIKDIFNKKIDVTQCGKSQKVAGSPNVYDKPRELTFGIKYS